MARINVSVSASGAADNCRAALRAFKKWWVEKLRVNGVPEPELSVKYIMDHVVTHYPISKTPSKVIANQFLGCRLKRMPVQYIIGEWDFRYTNLKMRPPVLIPRPETELVGLVLDHHGNKHYCGGGEDNEREVKFLDVGCGSGAISISLLKENNMMSGAAVDVSPEAVSLTRENAARNQVSSRLQVVHCSASECPEHLTGQQFDVIVSNPPYIERRRLNALQPEVLWYEDIGALDGGVDGTDVALSVLAMSRTVLQKHGSIWLEMDTNQDIQGLVRLHPACQHLEHQRSHSDLFGIGLDSITSGECENGHLMSPKQPNEEQHVKCVHLFMVCVYLLVSEEERKRVSMQCRGVVSLLFNFCVHKLTRIIIIRHPCIHSHRGLVHTCIYTHIVHIHTHGK